ncbi:SPOR domain-containing protein [Azospirillum sp. 412522]|nr:SPOR domain-containing protein [Azospirillum sp. 412522]MBY6262599.1 SPOR domain-containing protein [Azospirillum sp. 412522]
MKKLLLVVLALLLLAVAFGGGYYLAGGGLPGATAEAPKNAAAPGGVPDGGTSAGVPVAAPGGTPANGPANGPAGAKAPDAKDAKGAAAPPPPDIPVKPAAAPAKGGPVYTIELGAFRSSDNAKAFAGVMLERGLPVTIVETVDATGRPWLRVRAGSFADLWQAEARRPEYERVAGIGGVVVGETAPAAAAPPAAVPSAATP